MPAWRVDVLTAGLVLIVLAVPSFASGAVDVVVGHGAAVGKTLDGNVRAAVATSPSRRGLSIGLEGAADRVLAVGRIYSRERRGARVILFAEVVAAWLTGDASGGRLGGGGGFVLPFLNVTRSVEFDVSLTYGIRVLPDEVRYHAGLMVGF